MDSQHYQDRNQKPTYPAETTFPGLVILGDQDTNDKNVTLLDHTRANEFKIFYVQNV